MRSRLTRRTFLLDSARAAAAFALVPAALPQTHTRRIAWDDLSPVRQLLQAEGLSALAFPAFVDDVHADNLRRVREGDVDHLVFYALQSTHFTAERSVEPALSAKALVEGLTPVDRDAFLKSGRADRAAIPAAVRRRFGAFVRALDSRTPDARLSYFRQVVNAIAPDRGQREAVLLREYLRAMRFVYEKEFVAQRGPHAADAVAALYRTRGLSTDTAIEAGYLVSIGLGILKSLEPSRRIRRALIIGPGLDLAPRTGLLEAGPPESYQPWAVFDALVALGLARVGDLELAAADINPRVVDHLRRSRLAPPTLTLVSGIAESGTLTFSKEYREYVAGLGKAIGDEQSGTPSAAGGGHLRKTIRISPEVARAVRAEMLDVVTERLTEAPFDLILATNILPYFDDVRLTMAMANVAAMLAPGGAFVHNEPRALLQRIAGAFGIPFEQSRQAVIATVHGAAAPLVDSVWLHRKTGM